MEESKWWRKFNGIRALVWTLVTPVAYFFGWVNNVSFVSVCSLYANIASDVAAWRSDVNPDKEQLDRIEQKLDELLKMPR